MTRQVADADDTGAHKGHVHRIVDHVVEQRLSNLAQGLLFLATMAPPLLVVLHLIPQAVLAGLFFVMGLQALAGNGITRKLLFLCRDRSLTDARSPLARLRRRAAVWGFVALALLGFGATFAVTQTIAAIGFPVVVLLLIPVRAFVMPRWFTAEELEALDAPTASPFTMESVGGAHGAPREGELPMVRLPSPGRGTAREERKTVVRDGNQGPRESVEGVEMRAGLRTRSRPGDAGDR